ncbi:MAG TPA: metal ABC transporter ATP-binding protein [Candidatus Thermoplasmatota archaeon]|nr:metal ABC transporter ATP-binding protein [Candidatus Thermoplasmatota archaeon]
MSLILKRPLAEAAGLTVSYGGENILSGVDFTLNFGELVGIIGPNGGGKTTLVKALLGLAPVSSGEIRLFGKPQRAFREWTRIGYVPQYVSHVDARFPATALEVAMLGRTGRRGLGRWFTREDREKARAALDVVGMAHAERDLIGELSGGQRQRVFLAKALASEPELLILDEPTTGVDPGARESFYNLLHRLNEETGVTVLLVSHDTQALALTVHRLVVVNRSITYDGPVGEFEERGGFQDAYHLHVHHHGHAHDSPGGAGLGPSRP